MRKSIDIGTFRNKRLNSLVKEQNEAKSNANSSQRSPLFRNTMKNSEDFSLAKKKPLSNYQLPNLIPNNHETSDITHSKTVTDHSQSVPYSFQRHSILSPTTSSLKKLVHLQGPNKTYTKDPQTGPGPGSYHKELKIGGASYVIGKGQRIIHRKAGPVGPGSYESPVLPNGIQYSMTPRRKFNSFIPDSPGPGAYSPNNLESGIKFSITKADRNKIRKVESPGPGAYSISRPGSSRSALTVKSYRPPLSQVLDTPGPGSYNIELKIGGPEMSLRQKFAYKSQSIEPGPGSYSPSMGMTSPSWRFGSSKKRLEFNDFTVPVPGWYNMRKTTRY